MTISSRSTCRTPAAMAAACLLLAHAAAQAQTSPPAVQAIKQQHGVTVVGSFPAAGGLQAWAAYRGQTPMALYATPDGKHVIVGTMLDAKGADVNRAALDFCSR